MADLFISYARKDLDFVTKLHQALVDQGFEVWVDLRDIPPSADWWQEITRGLEAAHTVVFVITQHSLESQICHLELAYAIQLNKRLLPVVRVLPDENHAFARLIAKSLDESAQAALGARDLMSVVRDNWQHIRRHNWLFFQDEAQFPDTLRTLVAAMRTDFPYVREHTRLLARALEWQRRSRQPDFLLKGAELRESAAWIAAAGGKDPPPTALHREYILRSQQAVQRGRGRFALVGVLTTLISVILGGVLVFRWARPDPCAERMTGVFNVAIAMFGQQDTEGGETRLTPDSEYLSAQLARQLDDYRRANPALGEDLQVRYGCIPPITALSAETQQIDAGAIALRHNAYVVVFGHIDASTDPPQVVPMLYTNASLFGAEELSGQDSFGSPVAIRLPLIGDAPNTAALKAQVFPRMQAMAHFLYGLAFFRAEAFSAALTQYQAALSDDLWQDQQGEELLYLWVGTLYQRAHRLNQPLVACPLPAPTTATAIMVAPDPPDALLCAWAAYDLAAAQSFPRAYLGRGNILSDLATINPQAVDCVSFMAAVDEFRQAITVNQAVTHNPLIDLKAQYSLGLTYQTADARRCGLAYPDQDFRQMALDHLAAAQAIYPQIALAEARDLGARAHYQAGLVRSRRGEFDLALNQYAEVISLAQPVPPAREVEWQAIRWTAHWQRGRIFERLEDWNAALSEYLTIIDAAQKSRQLAAQAHFGAGTAYAELGKIEQARAQFQKVLDIADPSWPVAVEARKALEALG